MANSTFFRDLLSMVDGTPGNEIFLMSWIIPDLFRRYVRWLEARQIDLPVWDECIPQKQKDAGHEDLLRHLLLLAEYLGDPAFREAALVLDGLKRGVLRNGAVPTVPRKRHHAVVE